MGAGAEEGGGWEDEGKEAREPGSQRHLAARARALPVL